MNTETMPNDDTWLIIQDKYDPARVAFYESIFTLANGYVGVRGSPEWQTQTGMPGTFFAGVFDATPAFGSELANAPGWIGLSVTAAGETVNPERGGVLEYRRLLDMRRGLLFQVLRWQDPAGRITRLETHRLVHLARKRAGLIRGTLTPENYTGLVELRGGLDGYTFNTGMVDQIKIKHFELQERGTVEGGVYLGMVTRVSRIEVGEASRLEVDVLHERTVEYGRDRVEEVVRFEAQKG